MTPRIGTRQGFCERGTRGADLIAVTIAAMMAPHPVFGALLAIVVLRGGRVHRGPDFVADLATLAVRLAVVMLPTCLVVSDPRSWVMVGVVSVLASALLSLPRIGARGQSDCVARPGAVAVVVGEPTDIAEHVRQFAVHAELGVWPVATAGPDVDPPTMLPHVPWSGLVEAVRRHGADHVVVVSTARTDEVADAWRELREMGCRISVVPPFAGLLDGGAQFVDVRGIPMLSLAPRRPQTGIVWWTKRAMDIVGASAALVFSSPILLMAVAAIWFEDRGPVVFRQERVGRDGRHFAMLKLRSMVVEAERLRTDLLADNEASGPFFKIERDPRVTRVGRVLRRLSIDELPQLVNVLRGEMSLVGPRPCLPGELAEAPDHFEGRGDVRPGITGLWQVAGRSWLPAAEGARMDTAYVEHWSPLLDLRILARTAVVALQNDRRPPVNSRNKCADLDRQHYVGSVLRDDLRPSTEAVDVSIVIVAHEAEAQIASCIDSVLAEQSDVTREVIVVDNASTDSTAEIVRTQFPSVRLIVKRRRDGFATNSNIGTVASAGRHVMFLNPDARLRQGSLVGLCDHLDENPGVGAVGPALVYPDGLEQASARSFPTLVNGLVRRTPLRRLLPAVANAHLLDQDLTGHVRDVDWMLGGALLVRRRAMDRIGGFDDLFRLYCEDMDLCWRLAEQGWRVQQLSSVVVEHDLAEFTTKRFLTRRTLWHLRSALRFVRLHGFVRPSAEVDVPLVDLRHYEPAVLAS